MQWSCCAESTKSKRIRSQITIYSYVQANWLKWYFILRLYCCFIYYTVFLSDAVPKILVNEKNNLNISLCLLFVESVAVIKEGSIWWHQTSRSLLGQDTLILNFNALVYFLEIFEHFNNMIYSVWPKIFFCICYMPLCDNYCPICVFNSGIFVFLSTWCIPVISFSSL